MSTINSFDDTHHTIKTEKYQISIMQKFSNPDFTPVPESFISLYIENKSGFQLNVVKPNSN